MKYLITLQYEVDAITQIEAIRKIRDEEQLTCKHIETREWDGIQYTKMQRNKR